MRPQPQEPEQSKLTQRRPRPRGGLFVWGKYVGRIRFGWQDRKWRVWKRCRRRRDQQQCIRDLSHRWKDHIFTDEPPVED